MQAGPNPESTHGPDHDEILHSRADAAGDIAPPPPPSAPLAPGQVLGGYELLEPIGSGGFSVVWLARNVESGAGVALKLPRVPEFVVHLRREALIAERFKDPQVVGIQEVRLDAAEPFLVMPFIPGANLELPAQAVEPTEIIEAFRRFRKVVAVVARLHDADIVHGDLKPGNLRIDPQGVCHVLDLGLARHQVSARQGSTLRASVVSVTGEKIGGTLEFMAPEVLAGDKPTKAADVYALGILLHHLLCGRPPAFGVSPRELNPFLPPRTTDFLRQTLHPEPQARFRDAEDLLPVVDEFILAEERCLGRRNGHARRRVFHDRMSTLARGLKVVLFTVLAALVIGFGLPLLAAVVPGMSVEPVFVLLAMFLIVPGSCIGLFLGITTINAWILRVPEKSYKNRSGHPLWTFMMQ